MSIADLLNPSDPMFAWSHHLQHQGLFWKAGPPHTPATVFTEFTDANPAEMWQVDHQQAHDEMANVFNVQPSLRMVDEPIGSPIWTFWNWTEHLALSQAASVS